MVSDSRIWIAKKVRIVFILHVKLTLLISRNFYQQIMRELKNPLFFHTVNINFQTFKSLCRLRLTFQEITEKYHTWKHITFSSIEKVFFLFPHLKTFKIKLLNYLLGKYFGIYDSRKKSWKYPHTTKFSWNGCWIPKLLKMSKQLQLRFCAI